MLRRTAFALLVATCLAACSETATPATAKAATKPDEQAVIVSIKLSNAEFGASGESFALYKVEEAMEAQVEADGVGQWDGHEIGAGYFTAYFYGPDAEAIWRSIAKATPADLPQASYATIRSGPPGAPSRRVTLPPS